MPPPSAFSASLSAADALRVADKTHCQNGRRSARDTTAAGAVAFPETVEPRSKLDAATFGGGDWGSSLALTRVVGGDVAPGAAVRFAARTLTAGGPETAGGDVERLIAVEGVVVQITFEKPKIAALKPLHAETDRKPSGREVDGEVQLAAALHQAVVDGIGQRASCARVLPVPGAPSSASFTAS